jgi:menaquinone-dependent protoporphyrinogen IX oxidase
MLISGYGATEDAAKIISEQIINEGLNVDLSLVGSKDPAGYDVALIGSPIRLGQCSKKIKKFIKSNHTSLSRMQIGIFFTCMSITSDESQIEVPLYIDPRFNDPNKPRARMKFMEKNHTASYCLTCFLKIMPGIPPLSISFFKGRLNICRLSMFHRLIMQLAMFALPEIKNGDYLNKAAIQDWARRFAAQIKSG